MRPYSPQRLHEVLQHLLPLDRFWIAFSGGLDSMVLLHSIAALRSGLSGIELRAVHVDHGLHPQSADWSRWCVAQASELAISCDVISVSVARPAGTSLEAQARDARYAAFARIVTAGDCLITAHHADDQAETLLLQLLRGAGVHGLAAMPFSTSFAGGILARPLLEFTRARLAAYAADNALRWSDDPANENSGFDRNYLRHHVMPALRSRWPAVAETVSRSAHHCADAAELLDHMAALDMQRVADAGGALRIDQLTALPMARQRQLVRYWLRATGLPVPPATRVEQILLQAPGAEADRYPLVAWPGAEVRRYRDRLYAIPPLSPHDAGRELLWNIDTTLELPWLGKRLVALPATGEGLSARLCRTGTLTVQFRRGGESCRPAGRQHHKPLKKLFQEYGIPSWERDRVPLIYLGGTLAAAGGYWICDPYRAAPGEPGMRIEVRNMDLRNTG